MTHDMSPNLSNSISMHPYPFRPQPHTSNTHVSRSANHTPSHMNPTSPPDVKDHSGSSTAIETTAVDEAAIARHTSAGTATDIEVESLTNGRLSQYATEEDPYGLRAGYKTATELEEIKANTGRRRAAAARKGSGHAADSADMTTGGVVAGATTPSASARRALERGIGGRSSKLMGCVPQFGRNKLQARRLQVFYETQNETIERLLKSVEEHREEARQEQGDDNLRYNIAVWGSFVANVLLAILQLYGAISSGSLSLFTTMADAIFDPLSNVTLIVTNRAVKRVDPARFPSGKARLETVGNIVFCFIMSAVSAILIALSAKELADHSSEDSDTTKFHLPSVIAVCVAFATKLVLFLYTWSIKDRYSQIRILWQDHRNDLLINGFGVLTSVGGSRLVWWLDPAGAVVLSVIVSTIWLRTAFTEFLLLVGVVANVEMQQLITYVCLTHSPAIRQIDTVRVYHSGPRLIAEVDVVMNPADTLQATHDVAEELQFKLESLPDVERAYVHVDYETTHKPEHAYKKDL